MNDQSYDNNGPQRHKFLQTLVVHFHMRKEKMTIFEINYSGILRA